MTLEARQVLVCLLAAHILGEFLFRTDHPAQRRRWANLAGHAAVVSGLSYLLCGLWTLWPIPVVVLVAHLAIDGTRVRWRDRGPVGFLVELGAQTLVLTTLAWWAGQMSGGPEWILRWGPTYLRVLILLGGFVLSTHAGGALIGLAVRPLLAELREAQRHRLRGIEPESRGFENGGRWIGRLERGLIFLFIHIGQPAGIAFLIAAKSIFRFGEVSEHRHRMEAEYILIGTLMSFGYGILTAWLTKLLLALSWS